MRKYGSIVILLGILLAPMMVYFVLKQGTHKVAEVPVLSPKVLNPNPGTGPDSVFKTVPDFQLTSHTGVPVNLDTFKNYVWVANLFFTSSPSIAPNIMGNMKRIQERYKDVPDIRFLSISVDPETDSLPELQNYARRAKAIPDKWFLTRGNKSQTYEFIRKGMGMRLTEDQEEEGEMRFLHDNTLRLIDKEGKFRGGRYWSGTDFAEVDSMILDIHLLLREYRDQER